MDIYDIQVIFIFRLFSRLFYLVIYTIPLPQ